MNLATMTVLVAATWWSGAQRPVDQPALARNAAPVTTSDQPNVPAAQPTTGLQGTTVWRDGMQTVGYQPRTSVTSLTSR